MLTQLNKTVVLVQVAQLGERTHAQIFMSNLVLRLN